MSNWDRIRRVAREFHQEVCAYGNDKHQAGASADVLLAKAERVTGIKRKGYPKGHPVLQGALARLERKKIIFDNSVEQWLALYHQAHEYGHDRLGHGERGCTEECIDGEAAEDKLPLGVHRVEGYGPQERTECEANVFAREFLLPCDVLRKWFIEGGLNAEDIAAKVGVSIEMVCHQLARALLTPDTETAKEGEKISVGALKLDESQKQAAGALAGPLLIAAGPGTGKTRTLAGRVLYLLGSDVPPESILILTFSNKAAEELRDRVKLVAADEAQKIRIETFHSFGLDLLRKYGTKIGLPPKPVILDPVDALFLLERSLPKLDLDHYENLYEPTKFLNDILKAISRAKDENAGPDRYREYAEAMATSDEVTDVQRALEVARVYEFYQEYLNKNGLLDFGDLICRSIELLRKHPTVKDDVRRTYTHVLVDEYQDVNRASGLLLREVVGDGKGLWAVGDIRQSIHRWRGATTANMRLFSDDFPNAKPQMSLEVNYRSQPPIVDVFSEFVPQMSATKAAKFTPWQKYRKHNGGTVKYEIAADERAEAQGIAREIEENFKSGIPCREQAVICRSHTSLARVARYLEDENVPVLYLGDFFERPEVRDMLSLLSLACQHDGSGLLRVARFPEYDIPLSDVQALRRLAKEKERRFPDALTLVSKAEDLSTYGKEKLELLTRQLDDLCYGKSAWMTLTRYLFVRSSYLAPFIADTSVAGQQQRLALYQLIQFVHSHLGRAVEGGVDPKRDLLRYIRRLETFGEERQLRQVPAWADGIDAVRVLTIHASKGLEFSAVFLPVLGGRYMPTNNQRPNCPLPTGIIAEANQDWHLEEEECLFFVALSRARDHLCLSRAVKYGRAGSRASKFINHIAKRLPKRSDNQITWPARAHAAESVKPVVQAEISVGDLVFPERLLDVYLKCPRKYYYEFELGLGGRRDDSAYVQFHQCVYEALRWIQSQRLSGRKAEEEAQAHLGEVWQKKGPVAHPHEPVYRKRAEEMVEAAIRQMPLSGSKSEPAEHEVALFHGRVKLTFDYAELTEGDGESVLLIRRLRTGKPTKSEAKKRIYGLYQRAAQQKYPHAKRQMQILYLSTNEAQEVELESEQIEEHLAEYDTAIAGILQRDFQIKPNDHECPRCPHYFICPMAGESVAV